MSLYVVQTLQISVRHFERAAHRQRLEDVARFCGLSLAMEAQEIDIAEYPLCEEGWWPPSESAASPVRPWARLRPSLLHAICEGLCALCCAVYDNSHAYRIKALGRARRQWNPNPVARREAPWSVGTRAWGEMVTPVSVRCNGTVLSVPNLCVTHEHVVGSNFSCCHVTASDVAL